MPEVTLNATVRDVTGKKGAKQLRREGKVPAIFYAHNEKSEPLTVDLRELVDIVSVETNLFDLKIGKKKALKVIMKDVQLDPVTNIPLHADIMGVKMKEKIHLSVPVHIIGEAVGVKDDGGVLNQVLHEIEISCFPLDLPDHIDIDVSELYIGNSIHIKDLIPGNYEILNDSDLVAVSVIAPRALKEETPDEELEDEEVDEDDEESEEE